MRIWFVEIGEPLPLEKGKRLLRYGKFTAWLTARGHDVSWWASDFSHAVKAHIAQPGDHVLESGVKLHVLHGPGYRKNVSFARYFHHGCYARRLKKSLEAYTGPLPDLIVCPIPTVENAHVVSVFARKHNIPYVLDIRDHWPQDLINRFPCPLRILARIMLNGQFRQARTAAHYAAGVTGVTKKQMEYGLDLARRGTDTARDHVFYLGYSRTPLSAPARTEAAAWWREQGLKPDAKIIAFTGTLGISFDFGPMLAAARLLKAQGRNDIQFVVAGDGGSRTKLIRDAGDLAGDTVLFPGWIDLPKMDVLLSSSTVALAPYIPGTSMSLPNKFFEYMAYGLPVLSSCSGESEELIRTHQFGVQYDVADPGSFLRALLSVADAPQVAQAMGQTALNLFETRYEQGRLFESMESHINKLVRK